MARSRRGASFESIVIDRRIFLAYSEGRLPREIAVDEGVTISYVNRSIRRSLDRAEAALDDDVVLARARGEARYEQLFQLAMRELELSRQPEVEVITGRAEVDRFGNAVPLPDQVTTKTRNSGDIAYLKEMRAITREQNRLRGVEQPEKKAEINGSALPANTEAVLKSMARQLATTEEEILAEESAAAERDRAEADSLRLALSGPAEPARSGAAV